MLVYRLTLDAQFCELSSSCRFGGGGLMITLFDMSQDGLYFSSTGALFGERFLVVLEMICTSDALSTSVAFVTPAS